MATETLDWRAALAFIDRVKVGERCTAPADAPAWMQEPDVLPSACWPGAGRTAMV